MNQGRNLCKSNMRRWEGRAGPRESQLIGWAANPAGRNSLFRARPRPNAPRCAMAQKTFLSAFSEKISNPFLRQQTSGENPAPQLASCRSVSVAWHGRNQTNKNYGQPTEPWRQAETGLLSHLLHARSTARARPALRRDPPHPADRPPMASWPAAISMRILTIGRFPMSYRTTSRSFRAKNTAITCG